MHPSTSHRPVPVLRVSRVPRGWNPDDPFATGPWNTVRSFALVSSEGSRVPEQGTLVRVCFDEGGLYVLFHCTDRDAWSRFTRRDDLLYEEEAVEVFLAAGSDDPTVYYELEVSPRGVLFDARVLNPHGDRREMVTDVSWDWPGVRWAAGALGGSQDWWAGLALPWRGLVGDDPRPGELRGNFYRIERPRGAAAELSAWSPTLVSPPDFHRPARFGRLLLTE